MILNKLQDFFLLRWLKSLQLCKYYFIVLINCCMLFCIFFNCQIYFYLLMLTLLKDLHEYYQGHYPVHLYILTVTNIAVCVNCQCKYIIIINLNCYDFQMSVLCSYLKRERKWLYVVNYSINTKYLAMYNVTQLSFNDIWRT